MPHKSKPWYGQVMPRNKFQLMFHTMLHASHPDALGQAKIEPFVNILLCLFRACFYPFENLSLDEMVIGYKGRFQHKQFNAAKPDKYHVKTFGLCDSATGYVTNLLIYFGAQTAYSPQLDPTSGHAIKVFSTLLEPLGRNHHIFADRYYTTAALVQYLSDHQYNYTGTVQSSRRGFPLAWKTQQLQHMEAV